jgi:hypothetical protein
MTGLQPEHQTQDSRIRIKCGNHSTATFNVYTFHINEGRGAYRVLVGRPEGKRPLGRPRRRWEEIGIDGANWIRLAQDRVRWRAFVNTVMNLRVP